MSDMPRHRMTNLEYERLRDAIRTMRTEDPDLTPVEAQPRINAKLAKPLSYPAFIRQWKMAEPKKNGRRERGHPPVVTPALPAPAVAHEHKNVVTTPLERPANGTSKIRVLVVEAELGAGQLDQITSTIVGALAGRS